MTSVRRWVALLPLVLLALFARDTDAAEGMFLLDRLPAKRLEKSKLKIPVAKVAALSRAVVQVGRGGTGSFVSPRGLLVTNHHVAFRCLAALNSLPAHKGVMNGGYIAKDLASELPCPGYDLSVVREVKDVTSEVRSVLKKGMRWDKRFEAIRRRKAAMEQACEKRHGAGVVCSVKGMNGGVRYYLSAYLRVRDVRLVYAPPKTLGKFGGDIDNWMYPRHTADFTFLRAYVGSDGKARPYAKGNKPLATPTHLVVSRWGVKRGSLALVIGFPGRTSRHVTSHAVRFHTKVKLADSIRLLRELISTLHARQKASEQARRKYEGLEAGLQNAVKYYTMSRAGFDKWKVLDRKLEQEKKLLGAIKERRQRAAAKRLLKDIERIYKRFGRSYRRFASLHRLRLARGVQAAIDIVRWAEEKKKADADRKDQRYRDKNAYRFMGASKRLERETEIETEKALLLTALRYAEVGAGGGLRTTKALLRRARKWLARVKRDARKAKKPFAELYKQRFGVAPRKGELAAAIDMMFGASKLVAHGDSAEEQARAAKLRARLFKLDLKQVHATNDPLLRFARDAAAELKKMREGPYKEVEQRLATVLRPRWVRDVKHARYPDANFTVRLSFGSVRDYTSSKTGKRHVYSTRVQGVLRKHKGKYPFDVPAWLRAAAPTASKSPWAAPELKDVPVNFTTTLDTTGGNSGSPVLDDKGRLIGLLFDGTPESILSDWQYLPAEQRSICVDMRYVMWLANVQRAKHVLSEIAK
ncbi:MAG: S46 family peptidase [Myxococcales bacterium]|nr:S46 family peptidase [Myxococcales bacterium]